MTTDLAAHDPLRVAVAELGPDAPAAGSALRALRDAGHEVVYVGVLAPEDPALEDRLGAVCVQEDVDALVLFGQAGPSVRDRVRERIAALGAEEIVVLPGEPDPDGPRDGTTLTTRVETAARTA